MSQSPHFSKILVANRGEIACRVFQSAKRLGIATVAVYSNADAGALHVKHADEAVCIGGTSASESYLVIDKIIDACKSTGADAVHPGYGFLSEQAEFEERLASEGITFIGPSGDAMRAMGDKITSKKLSSEAGVNTVPGFMGVIDDVAHCQKIAEEIGYPVMIKASAGGGGKGMRIAWNAGEVTEGFTRSKSEALSSFGDDRIFVEKFITDPRHIEIQVLADKHGNCVYLGERECSIQRRNQKVVEEAPSPFLDEATRRAMGEQAVALSQAVSYSSAGTVEFIVDSNKNFYFLEMNTRLQVEHPVTELITGIDLVEQMIRVAAGLPLSITQDQVKLNGWAMESRVYAEDPTRNFLPSIGRLQRYQQPLESVHSDCIVRCDTGVEEGGEVSMFYDPMLAKLCTWAPDRLQAIDAMEHALDSFELQGVGNNLAFLSAIMGHERFRSGNISTAFIDQEYADGFNGVELTEQTTPRFVAAAAVAALIESDRMKPVANRILQGGSADEQAVRQVVRINGENHTVSCSRDEQGFQLQLADGKQCTVTTAWQPNQRQMLLELDGEPLVFQVKGIASGIELNHRGSSVSARVISERKAELAALMLHKEPEDTSNLLLCPMPGLVVALHVNEGDTVQAGQPLAVVEAMKMENVLSAEKTGVIKSIPVSVGQSLQVDAIIMEFEV